MQRYEVQPGHILIMGGQLYRAGAVLPEWKADQGGALKAHLDRGVLAPTAKAQTHEFAPPTAREEKDPLPAVIADNERLTKRVRELESTNKDLEAHGKELAVEKKRLEDALARTAPVIAQLEGACEDHQRTIDEKDATIEKLQTELNEFKTLDEATAPA